MTKEFVLTNGAVLDAQAGVLINNSSVVVRDGRIVGVSKGSVTSGNIRSIDVKGRTIMPGLIDCHVHLNRTLMPAAAVMLPSLMTAWAGVTLRGMLSRGFTTVRDAGGVDAGLRQAVERKFFIGPTLFVSGRGISQTGGNGDARSAAELVTLPCECTHLVAGMGRLADGVPEVLKAVRDELRLGADQIKLIAGGGCGVEHGSIEYLQYSTEEMQAAVDEATRAGTYVMAHVYVPKGITRAVECGVRTIEHGSFLDDDSAKAMVRADAILSPNIVIYKICVEEGIELGFTAITCEKSKPVLEAGTKALDIAKRHGVKMCFSTDMSKCPERQSEEFLVRAEVLSPAEIIRSATVTGAEVVRRQGLLGTIATGATADILVVDGNPLENISLLTGQGKHLSAIIKGGEFFKNDICADTSVALGF